MMKTNNDPMPFTSPTVAESDETANMKCYRFWCGCPTTSPAHFSARIRAHSPEEALKVLRRVLRWEQTIDPCGDDEDNARVECIDAYFEADNVTLDDIDDEKEIDDSERSDWSPSPPPAPSDSGHGGDRDP